MNPLFFEHSSASWEQVEPKIKRQIVSYDDHLMMVHVLFEKGGVGDLHHHPHSQVTHIASGKFEVTIGDETKELSKGDCFFIPSNTIHGVSCLESGLLVDVFSPMREDFITKE